MSLSVALRHAFPGFAVDVAFDAPPGVTSLFGASGAGKTTVLQAIAGLFAPERGRIVADGVVLFDSESGANAPPHRRRVGYVFQDARLFPHLTVRANLTYARWIAGRRTDAQELDRVVALLGIGHLLGRRPARLSGGEKQRVAIGRALVAAPRVLLLDEPLAALDDARKAEILPYLERLRDETRIPIVHVSHSVAEVTRLATTVVEIEAGRVRRVGPPASLAARATEEAPARLSGRVLSRDADGTTTVAVSAGRLRVYGLAAPVGAAASLAVRPADVVLVREAPAALAGLDALPARFLGAEEAQGGAVLALLRCGEDRLAARLPRHAFAALALAPGEACVALVREAAPAGP